MARYQLFIAYDGTDFHGSQRQGKKRTVQLVLEDVLRTLGWKEKSIQLAGRTDSGVHATGQVACLNLDWKHPILALQNALNSRLPADLAVTGVEIVDESFHARYSASNRTYRYRIFTSPFPNPLVERYAWRVWPEPSIEILQKAAALYLGRHDFTAFGVAPKKDGNTIRQVVVSHWNISSDGLEYVVCATGFLYHMVRRMVQNQLVVSSGKASMEALSDAICFGKGIRTGMSPAKGLVLENVSYDKTNSWYHNLELDMEAE